MAMDGGSGIPSEVEHNDGEQRSNLNISDVFEAISCADPSFQAAAGPTLTEMLPVNNNNPIHEQRPYVRIIEQPASKGLRFRYICEGRSAGSIPGANSTPENKTYPTIEIVGHHGRAVVVVSCVTKDKPYKPHPHNLVGRDLCKNGVCTVKVVPDNMVVSFSNLGIQCVKKKDIEEALRTREAIRVDPFKTGFAHKNQPQSIDLNAVRLCFQVFLEVDGKIKQGLHPQVSDVIYDKKAMNDLLITRLSHCAAPVIGGKQIILLCEKVAKEDIAVTFFEKSAHGQITWQADAVDIFVHKQVAICFTTPRYHNINVTEHVQAYIQLRRPTDNERSEALHFEFIPMSSADPNYLKRKRQKPLSGFSDYPQPGHHDLNQPSNIVDYYDVGFPREQKIKLEPRDKTPPHAGLSALGGYRTITTPSPHHEPPNLLPEHYQWNQQLENLNLAVPGPSHLGQPFSPQDMNWAPNMGHVSPNMGHMSPNMGHVSPNINQMVPNMGQLSINMDHLPNLGHVSPTMVPQATNLTQLTDANLMETSSSDAPSITRLLDGGEIIPQLNSTELSGLSNFLDEKHDS